jgi:tRNA pseudouridine38-40 synthase
MIEAGFRKVAILTSYDGTPFFGWQRQKNEITVQQKIEDVLTTIFQKKTVVHGAGRTDAGVHSIGQVAHFESPVSFELDRLAHSINSMLPPEIKIINIAEVQPDFHSRFSAKSKTYIYIINRERVLSPFLKNYCCHLPEFGGLTDISQALEILKGEHNFETFTSAEAVGESAVRRIYSAKLIENGNFIFLSFTADGFLRYLVRTLVGTLIKIGNGKITLDDFKNALSGVITQPLPSTLKMMPSGLYLLNVDYDNDPFQRKTGQNSAIKTVWPFIKEIDLWRLLD